MLFKIILSALIIISTNLCLAEDRSITVGSKRFTENYILAEIFSQLLESNGYVVTRKFGMGGTMVAYNALRSQKIDIYPEYTGTVAEAIIKKTGLNYTAINEALKADNTLMLSPLGFNNSYCLVMTKNLANENQIQSISDLKRFPNLKGGFSAEFQGRKDGWPSLAKTYSLKNEVLGIEVPLTYQAIKQETVGFAEAYSTEPMVKKMNFIILKDDLDFFPKYQAVALIHNQLQPKAKTLLNQLAGGISHDEIVRLNTRAIEKVSIPKIAQQFLIEKKWIQPKVSVKKFDGVNWSTLIKQTKTHLFLTLLAVLLATLVAVPLASIFASHKKTSQVMLAMVSLMQTVPSIALLAFMIPLFGIGFKPAIIGLFIYSLLPILRNTHTAMNSIDPKLITAAKGIGLYPLEIFMSVKLPLAFPTILAGIRTATILNIGTATLAAFIGAGGLGEPIVAGLALNNNTMILQGAIPAAALAIFIDLLFNLVEKMFTKYV